MDFHQTSAERFAEKIYNYISEKFDGMVINSDECNVDLMVKNIPFNINEDDIVDIDDTDDTDDTDGVRQAVIEFHIVNHS